MKNRKKILLNKRNLVYFSIVLLVLATVAVASWYYLNSTGQYTFTPSCPKWKCTQNQLRTPFSCQAGEDYFCSSVNNILSCLSNYNQCSDGTDNDGDGKTDLDDPGCSDISDSDEYNVYYQCSDGIDNDGDGSIDFPDDTGCYDKFDNSETNDKEYAVVLVDCKGDCRTKGWSPDSLCSSQLGSEWHALSVDCDEIDADGDILFAIRDLSTKWNAASWGWCKDTSDDDMTVTCTKLKQNIKVVLADCKGTCQEKGFSPESICQSQVGSSWHALSIDCDTVEILNIKNDINERNLSMVWSGNDAQGESIGWCSDTGDDDMTVTCTDSPPYSGDIKAAVINCNGDCRTKGWSPDGECQTVFGYGWHALSVDCQWLDAEGEITFAIRKLTQIWNNVSVGWCSIGALFDAWDADMILMCQYITPPPKPQCSDGIDNDGDGKIDFPKDIGCSDENDNDEKNIPKTYETVLVDCKGDCRTRGWSPDSICRTQLGSEWHALSVDCDDLDADGDITFALRNLSTLWDSTSYGWCKDTSDDDMTVTCTKLKQNVKVVLADCKGTCQEKGFSPESICQSNVGSSWHALSVDCDAIQILNQRDSSVTRDLSMQWVGTDALGQSIGWCADTSDDDMAVFCTDVPPYSSDIKTVIEDCKGDCRTKGLSPDGECQRIFGNNWRALSVDCEELDAEGDIIFDIRNLDQTWSSNVVGWCKDTPDADITISCYYDRKTTTYSCSSGYSPSCSADDLYCTKATSVCSIDQPFAGCTRSGSCSYCPI